VIALALIVVSLELATPAGPVALALQITLHPVSGVPCRLTIPRGDHAYDRARAGGVDEVR
jgi:hypothetical protein